MKDFSLTQEEEKVIQRGMRHAPKAEVRQRATAIHLLHQGHRAEKVAEMMAVSMGSIYTWHKRWQEGGLEGLANRPKSGRPGKADEAYCKLLEQVLESEPGEHGYAFGVWTVDRLREHLRQQSGISLSNRRFRALMKRQGYVYRRPKHDVTALQGATEVERGKQLVDWLKKEASAEPLNSSLWTKAP